jgi:hypothetical protein
MSRFRPEDKLSRAPQMISTDLDQETVLMSIDAGAYYGLAGPAQRIWEELGTPVTFSSLIERLVAAYNVTPETCTADVEKFLAVLEREGLLHVE